jgi:hypothetical protein
VWGLFDINVALNQIVDPGGTMCFGAKWAGTARCCSTPTGSTATRRWSKQAHRLFSEADAVVTYNGDRFDIPKLQGEFLHADMPPPPPVTSIDVYKAIKKLGCSPTSWRSSARSSPMKEKLKHEGMELWTRVIAGCPESPGQDAALLLAGRAAARRSILAFRRCSNRP